MEEHLLTVGENSPKRCLFLLNKQLIKNVQGELGYLVPGRLFPPPQQLDTQEYLPRLEAYHS